MHEQAARERVRDARVGRLATVRDDGRPHVVPCCYALIDDSVFTAVDAKPKSTTALQRLANIAAVPYASLVVDHYDDDDWTSLWWVRVDGSAAIVDDEPTRERALDALAMKYEQYRDARPRGAVVELRIEQWRWWSAR